MPTDSDTDTDPWQRSCGKGLLIGAGPDAWLLMWATDGERGPFHADGVRAAGLSTSDRYITLVLYAEGTFELFDSEPGERAQALADLKRLRPGLEEREWSDPDGLWDFG